MKITASQRIVKSVVISLENSRRIKGFWEHNSDQFNFELFDGFDGRVRQGSEYFDKEKAERIFGKPVFGGEVGCAISHLQVIREFAYSDGQDSDLLLVAEDDARLVPDARIVVDRILSKFNNIELLILAEGLGGKNMGSWVSLRRNPTNVIGNMSFKFTPVGSLPNVMAHRVGHVSNALWGAGLYLISRSAAKSYLKLTDNLGRSHWLADYYFYWADKAKIDVLVCRPGLATWEGESEILGREEFDLDAGKVGGSLLDRIRLRVALRTRLTRFRASFAATIHERKGGSFPYLDKYYTG